MSSDSPTIRIPLAGPYAQPSTAVIPSKTGGIKTIVVVCLLILLGINVIAILAHTTAFATTTVAATVRELTEEVVSLMGLTTKGAVATAKLLDHQIEDSLNAVGQAASVAGKVSIPEPDSSFDSAVQCRGQQGWCYVGTQDGYRSCLEVGPNNYCQSGNVYPTRDVCINPSLRK